eukprot:6472566-Amphidinium_carterae.1
MHHDDQKGPNSFPGPQKTTVGVPVSQESSRVDWPHGDVQMFIPVGKSWLMGLWCSGITPAQHAGGP